MKRLAPVVGILLIAAAFRIVNTGHWPVWTDEGWSTWAASDHHVDVIVDRVLTKDRHPPAFVLALSAWWTIAGDSRIALRFLAIAGGLLTVAALYRLTADAFGRGPGLYAALLLAILPSAVYYSQEIRDYGWLTLSVTLMSLFFVRYLQKPSRAAWVGYVISTVFMLYTLYLGALILAIQVGIGLLAWRVDLREKMRLVGSWVVCLILYIPWLVISIKQLQSVPEGIASLPSTWTGFLVASEIVLGGQLALTAGLCVLGLWRVIERPTRSVRWLAQMTIVLSGIGLFGLMFAVNLRVGLLAPRTLVFLTPMVMAICAYGLSQLDRRARSSLAVALLVLLPATALPLQPRLDYQVAAQAVAAEYTPGDLVVLENGWDDNAFRYEIMLALGDSAEPLIIRTLPWVDNRQMPIPVVPQIEDLLRAHRRVFVVNWLQPPQVIPFLDQGNDGFIRTISREVSVGAQYLNLYKDNVIRVVMFERPVPAAFGAVRQFGDLFALHDAILPAEITRGQSLHVDLWWTALKTSPLDYSAGVFLLDASGAVQAQQDGPLADQPTSTWSTDTLKFDRHTLSLPLTLTPGTYRVGVQVYWYGDRTPLLVGTGKFTILDDILVR